MKALITMIFCWTSCTLIGQKYSEEYTRQITVTSNEINYTIYSASYKIGKEKMDAFIAINNYTVYNQNETKNSHFFQFNIPQTDIRKIDSICLKLGYVSSKNLNSHNNENQLTEANLELDQLHLKKSEYEKMLIKIDSVKSDRYYQHWEKIRSIELEIFQIQKKIKQLETVKDLYLVSIYLNDEQSSPTNNKVSFVHMPGAEFSYLFTENPKPNISGSGYQGVNLKYLFTKGKSYFSLGALKAIDDSSNDSLRTDEMFNFIFGQDWYNKHFGRGNNKFINLYIGYQVGYTLAYSKTGNSDFSFASPVMGIELFKNKYLLIDSNLSYFLPLHANNRFTRGWRVAGSLNFSF